MSAPQPADDRGAQALELAAVMPVVLAVALLAATAGQVALAAITTHHLASTAARIAAVAHDDRAGQAIEAGTAAARPRLRIEPPSGSRRPGDLVTATVERPVQLLVLGIEVTVSAQASHLTEDVP